MRIAVPTETEAGEARVAATPETVKKFRALGASVAIQRGAGLASGITDADYEAAGAELAATAAEALRDADIVLKVRRPGAELAAIRPGAAVIAIMDPYGQDAALAALAQAGVEAFAMELMPRITRAQVMDVLSSQANLAGYRSVIDAAAEYGRAFPMMMTAAGTVPAAKVFVMGVGVAGLQAIATARRLGAIVTATDVRPATKEQVESLGAKFVAVEDEEFKQAETAGGYAKEMSKEYQAKQATLVRGHIARQDIVITTALIPGRPAPRLITAEMVRSMRPGSVIVDLAVERGGNCELAKPGEVAVVDGVKILGHLNVAGRLAATASALYAKNLYAFVETLIDKKTQKLAINPDDELVKATCLTRGGTIVHPNFQPKPGAVPAPTAPPAVEEHSPASAAPSPIGAAPPPASAEQSPASAEHSPIGGEPLPAPVEPSTVGAAHSSWDGPPPAASAEHSSISTELSPALAEHPSVDAAHPPLGGEPLPGAVAETLVETPVHRGEAAESPLTVSPQGHAALPDAGGAHELTADAERALPVANAEPTPIATAGAPHVEAAPEPVETSEKASTDGQRDTPANS
jgi:NAD(P) transhydrogenase subunit alpha